MRLIHAMCPGFGEETVFSTTIRQVVESSSARSDESAEGARTMFPQPFLELQQDPGGC